MNTAIIPQTYQEWHHCITVICQQPLTLSYVEERITALNSSKDYMTKKFVQLYGESQRQKTLQWFEQAKNELK
ncbi:hypothetical protein C0W92_19245 [Photobacterium angustum]|uniref:Uncharacterized protein n=2 Tax=Photobacterium angustum TaxID=661 RepID=A0A855S9J2_PHOAN|nr:hypothetical protein [Photobacterium angustum]KJF81738.1 hypothetical protein UB36_10190 [Photobacterium damselae subsp. damselae]EAS64875.1 hypothetical protein VAS14_04128 [Photobacterium angustum S14]KJG01723.1 hypothetical protein UB35_10995 [Photobacterium angustum]KJG15975.1 hypothetical protein UA33_16695 [Photobacterium angustum]KJG21764.1 hypothetical protein UA39_16495 [Photobacterium angustum]